MAIDYWMAMGYVEDMRGLLGTRPLLFVGCAVLIFDEAGRVLLERRADNGQWGSVGGIMELGETFEETARREVREEVGLELVELRLVGLISGPPASITYPNGDQSYTVGVGFTARYAGGDLRLDPSEVREARWFPLDCLPEDLSPRTRLWIGMHQGQPDQPGCITWHA